MLPLKNLFLNSRTHRKSEDGVTSNLTAEKSNDSKTIPKTTLKSISQIIEDQADDVKFKEKQSEVKQIKSNLDKETTTKDTKIINDDEGEVDSKEIKSKVYSFGQKDRDPAILVAREKLLESIKEKVKRIDWEK